MNELSKIIANIQKAPTRIHSEGYTLKAIKKAEDLERQLAEARGLTKYFSTFAPPNVRDKFKEQLKEKGE